MGASFGGEKAMACVTMSGAGCGMSRSLSHFLNDHVPASIPCDRKSNTARKTPEKSGFVRTENPEERGVIIVEKLSAVHEFVQFNLLSGQTVNLANRPGILTPQPVVKAHG